LHLQDVKHEAACAEAPHQTRVRSADKTAVILWLLILYLQEQAAQSENGHFRPKRGVLCIDGGRSVCVFVVWFDFFFEIEHFRLELDDDRIILAPVVEVHEETCTSNIRFAQEMERLFLEHGEAVPFLKVCVL
jgi:hypothetical protein